MSPFRTLLESHMLILAMVTAVAAWTLMLSVLRAQSQTTGTDARTVESLAVDGPDLPATTPPLLDTFTGRVRTATFALG